jgi:Caspase domain
MSKLLLQRNRTLVILIGTYTYSDSDRFSNIAEQGSNNIQKLAKLLMDPSIIGITSTSFHIIEDKTNADAERSLREIFNDKLSIIKFDSLLLYYVGHGVRDRYRQELVLTFTNTIKESLISTGLTFAAVNDICKGANNIKQRIYILDCCHSGQAENVLGAYEDNLFQVVDDRRIRGAYLAAASSPHDVAHIGKGAKHTLFTGALLDLMENGIDIESLEDDVPMLFIDSSQLETQLSNKLNNTESKPHFVNKLSSEGTEGILFNFFHNTKHTIFYINQCCDNKDFEKAGRYLKSIVNECNKINDFSEGLIGVTKKFISEYLKQDDERACFYYCELKAVESGQINNKVRFLDQLPTKEWHKIILDRANTYFYRDQDFQRAKVRYDYCLELDKEDYTSKQQIAECEEMLNPSNITNYAPKMLSFKTDSDAVILGANIEISWHVENVKEIEIIEHPSERKWSFKKSQGTLSVIVSQSNAIIIYKLICLNFQNVKIESDEIVIRVYAPPLFNLVEIPVPAYKSRLNLDGMKIGSPFIDSKISIPNFIFDSNRHFKTLKKLNINLTPTILSNKSLIELYEYIRKKVRNHNK